MPELPEVETTRRGIAPYLLGQTITSINVHESRLRWPLPDDLPALLEGQRINELKRRGKYLLFGLERGTLIAHLGMSGSLRVVTDLATPLKKHDHVEICVDSGVSLRFHDPRRFGALLHTLDDPLQHPLLAGLGVEPLCETFSGRYLYQQSRNRRIPIKSLLMDNHVVTGVGNIYANEALFQAGLLPSRQASRIGLARYQCLVHALKDILTQAISQGGTTLRDFVNGQGKPGYFQQTLQVYGRAGEPCTRCGQILEVTRLGQRSTFYCPCCQR